MSNIYKAFENGKAFIAFLTCGDPDLEATERFIGDIADGGADLIELGIPFSDPTAEGPVIQEANIRALSAGTTTDRIFEMVRRVRKKTDVPMVFMTYANAVFSYGTERFAETAAAAGMDGLILPDVPYEEKEDFAPACRKHGMDFISFVAPTSEKRISMIAKEAEGFLYCISSLGVTGIRKEIHSDISEMMDLVHSSTDIPAAVGFGISTPDQAAEMAARADGVIVGSAIVKLIAQYGRDAGPYVREYVKSMKEGARR